jgi:dihydrofolate reductase
MGFGSYWPAVANDESADPRDRAFSKWLNSAEKIVFSSTLKEATWESSRIVNADPASVIEELRQQEGGDIIVLASSAQFECDNRPADQPTRCLSIKS